MSTTTATSILQAPASRGVRFAPSPTGRFHVGNLRTAWISQQLARSLRLPWVVRFEDIDEPRVAPGARELQLEDMAALGLIPDQVLTQSAFRARHWETFVRGVETGRIYPCDCSRKDVQSALAGMASAPNESSAHAAKPVYSGHCRTLGFHELRACESIAWRFKMPDASGQEDFIVARSTPELDAHRTPLEPSFVPAYHWACAVDDFDGQYDLLVRSHDLSTAAPLQRAIQSWLGELECEDVVPAIFHTTLILQNDGHRLEKRTNGVTLPELALKAIAPPSLVWKFQQSFDAELLRVVPSLGAIFGERRETMTLQDLGL